jgi:hypothetical protein
MEFYMALPLAIIACAAGEPELAERYCDLARREPSGSCGECAQYPLYHLTWHHRKHTINRLLGIGERKEVDSHISALRGECWFVAQALKAFRICRPAMDTFVSIPERCGWPQRTLELKRTSRNALIWEQELSMIGGTLYI